MADWFLYPQRLLWLGLALPIIIVHLLKFRPRPLSVPSTRLWREAIQEPVANRFFAPFRHLKELLLQLLALICLVLALAGAQIPELGTPPRQILYALDGRASMLAKHGGQSRLASAKRYMQAQAKAAAPTDTFGLTLVSDQIDVVLPPGSTTQALMAALDTLEIAPKASDAAAFARALQAAKNSRVEGEEVVFLTAPLGEDEVFPAGLGVRTFGVALENRGISALHLVDDDLGNLVITVNLFLPSADAKPPLVLEKLVGETWQIIDSEYPTGRVVHFNVPRAVFPKPTKLRVRFEEADDFEVDDHVEISWRVLPNLRLSPKSGALQALIDSLRLDGAPELAAQGEIVVVAESTAAPVSGDLQRMPSAWWLNVTTEALAVEKLVPLDNTSAAFTPLLVCQGAPLAGVEVRRQGSFLLISAGLLDLTTFQNSNLFLALVGSWYRERQFAAIGSETRGKLVPYLLDYRLSERVTFKRALVLEAPPLAGVQRDVYAFPLADWLFWLGVAVLLFEFYLYLRRSPQT